VSPAFWRSPRLCACADKALPHVRILNAIRIAAAAPAAFIEARRVGATEE
jgi:hypothetical protein